MGKFDFDKPTERFGTDSYKWQVGEGELPMWVADMDFETAPCVREAILSRAEQGIFGYSVIPDSFFEAVAGFFEKRHSYRPSPSDMIFSTGVVATVSSAVRALTAPGEGVAVMPPVYNIFYNSIKNNHRRVIECPLVFDGEGYSIDFDALEEKLSKKEAKLLIFCNPHNPIGRIWTCEELLRVGEICKRWGVTVFSDEIHCSVTNPDSEGYTPFASVSETCRNISVSAVSASKAFNLAGLQAAAVIVPNEELRYKMRRSLNTDECAEPNSFAIAASEAALRCGGEWLDGLLKYLFENRRIAENYINEKIEGLRAIRGEATYLLWIDARGVCESSTELAGFIREKTGLYLSDGAEYGRGGERFLRMNLATQRARLLDGLSRLERAIELFKKK